MQVEDVAVNIGTVVDNLNAAFFSNNDGFVRVSHIAEEIASKDNTWHGIPRATQQASSTLLGTHQSPPVQGKYVLAQFWTRFATIENTA